MFGVTEAADVVDDTRGSIRLPVNVCVAVVPTNDPEGGASSPNRPALLYNM